MPTSRNDTRVLCPFYQYDESIEKARDRHIVCEGLVDGSTLVLNYKSKHDFRIQLDTFCCEHFARCEVYRMLMDTKYSDK